MVNQDTFWHFGRVVLEQLHTKRVAPFPLSQHVNKMMDSWAEPEREAV